MEQELISLICIVGISFLCPLLSALIPNKLIPETVFLLLAGMLLGPHVLGAIVPGDAIGLLSDLGLAFLFLLAGCTRTARACHMGHHLRDSHLHHVRARRLPDR